jgi:Leucine-rich repeat (LRR) protein
LLKQLNLRHNFLNGVLDPALGEMVSLEVLNLDNNQITAFPPNTQGWVNLRVLTASSNAISGKYTLSPKIDFIWL